MPMTLHGRERAMLNYANIEGDIHKSPLVECRKTATNLDGIPYGKNQTENSYTKMFKKNPGLSTWIK